MSGTETNPALPNLEACFAPPRLSCPCNSHHTIMRSYARAASSSRSKHPSEVGLPFRRNCASQRRVGNVWCTPRYLLVYVRPLETPFCLATLCTDWRTPASDGFSRPSVSASRVETLVGLR